MLTRSVEHQPPTSHITKPFLKSWGPSSSSSVPKYPQPFGILFYPFLCRTHRFYPCRRHRTLWSTCRRPSRRPFRLPPPRPPRRCSFRQLRCRTSGLLWSLRWVEWPWCGIGRSFRQHPWCSRGRLPHLRWSSWIRIYLWRTSWWRYVWLSSVSFGLQHFWLKIAGYYADPEAECQVFHICTAGANGADGALSKYSFLCPNGTIFNQNYFICDWWFNFDCAEAADLYSLNDDIAAERDAASGALDSYGAATESRASYGAPEEEAQGDYAAPADYDYGEDRAADAYAAPTEVDLNALPVYEESQATYEGEAPGAVVEIREGRRFRGGRQGRRGGRRQGRRGGRRQGRGQRGFRGWIVPSSFLSSTFWSLSYYQSSSPIITCLYCNLNFGAKIVIIFIWSIVVTILSSKSLWKSLSLSENSPFFFLLFLSYCLVNVKIL